MTSTSGPDAGLRRELRAHLKQWQWSHIESPTTSPGCPDTEFCAPGGGSGWVECKRTPAYALSFRPLQVGWLDRRSRLGGKCFVAVRRLTPKGLDELWLYPGVRVTELVEMGLRAPNPLGTWAGGPSKWNWREVSELLGPYGI